MSEFAAFLLDNSFIMAISGTVTTVGGAWLVLQKIFRSIKKARQEQSAKILQEAKEEVSRSKNRLEEKIRSLESDLGNLRDSVQKDIQHIKETHSAEIKNLGDKIEQLRDDLREQHAQILGLLGKMIEK